MGTELFEGYFSARLARHNSEKDKRHNALWLDFINQARWLAANKKYEEIDLEIRAMTWELQ